MAPNNDRLSMTTTLGLNMEIDMDTLLASPPPVMHMFAPASSDMVETASTSAGAGMYQLFGPNQHEQEIMRLRVENELWMRQLVLTSERIKTMQAENEAVAERNKQLIETMEETERRLKKLREEGDAWTRNRNRKLEAMTGLAREAFNKGAQAQAASTRSRRKTPVAIVKAAEPLFDEQDYVYE